MTAPVGDDPTWLDDLERAHDAATPGRWMADSHEIYQEWPGIPGMSGEWIGETCRVEGDPLYATSDADAALIVAAVNAVPELLRLAREREALREKVETVAAWCEEQAASRTHFAKVDPAYRDTVIPYEAAADRLTAALTPESVPT